MVEPIVGNSESTTSLKSQIERIAMAEVNTLITGETGVGKELVVKHLYDKSKRAGKPFIKINCAALPETLLESELFGYKKGSFTGAEQESKGKFELANGGVLFLDEIGDMAVGLQAKILHVLQDGYFTPIGSGECLKTDVWCISATNRDIQQEIEIGNFRQDLYYRLSVVGLHIEPLRNRVEDIPQLLNYFLNKYSKKLESKKPPELNVDLLEKLNEHSWPGNIRELQNYTKKYIFLGENNIDLTPPTPVTKIIASNNDNTTFFEEPVDIKNIDLKKMGKKARDREEKRIINYVLRETGWVRTDAAKILKISYKTLLNKIDKLEISPPYKTYNNILGSPKPDIFDSHRLKVV